LIPRLGTRETKYETSSEQFDRKQQHSKKLGIPSAAIITAEFVGETKLTRQALGMPDLEPVVIDHPVSSITQDQIDARIRQIRERAQKVWIAG
jgi:hypothetical protein